MFAGLRAAGEMLERVDALAADHDVVWQTVDALAGLAHGPAWDDTVLTLLDDLHEHITREEYDPLRYPAVRTPRRAPTAGNLGWALRDPDLADTLEGEHDTIDANLGRTDARAWDRRAYFELAAHIEQEEMELFPAAMFAFDDDDWSTLADVFRRADMYGPPTG